jgi:hypothetical protein
MGYVVDGPIGKNPAKQVVETSKKGTNGFKKGGSCMKKGGQVMSSAHKGERPARATGGGVFSSASGPGTKRAVTPKPY